jgi:hypothetical protein
MRATVLEENPVRNARNSLHVTAHRAADCRHSHAHPQGIAFGEVGKKLGEKWKALTAEERAPYDAQAAADKERFMREDKAYKAGGAGGGGASDGDADMADDAEDESS